MYLSFVRIEKSQNHNLNSNKTIGSLLRSSLLVWISTRAFPLHFPHFIQAITSRRLTWTLPWKLTMILMVMLVACIVPAPLWAAAISPIPADREIISTITIPTFNTSNTTALWSGNTSTSAFINGQWRTLYGLFSFSILDMRESLLLAARDASISSIGTLKRAKLDNTGFSYWTRSYGTGAAAGISKVHAANSTIRYHFNETGFRIRISCFRNSSIDWGFSKVSEEGIPVYQSHGELADGSPSGNTFIAAWSAKDLFQIPTTYNKPARKIQLQLVNALDDTEDDFYGFRPLKDIQCDLKMTLQKFKITVDNTTQLVSSVPLEDTEFDWPDYGDEVARKLVDLFAFSTFADTCISGCSIGRALVMNMLQLFRFIGQNSDATKYKAIEDFFGSIYDNLLVNLLLTRLFSDALEPTTNVTAIATVPSYLYGDIKFIVIIGILNLVILLIYIAELIRTRAWIATPALDIMNDSEVIIAAFEGGRQFERKTGDAPSQSSGSKPISEETTLKFQYNGLEPGRPIFMPQTNHLGMMPYSAEEPLLQVGFTSRLEDIPLGDIRNSIYAELSRLSIPLEREDSR